MKAGSSDELTVHPPGLEPGTHWLRDWPDSLQEFREVADLAEARERRLSSSPGDLVDAGSYDRPGVVIPIGASA